MNHDEEFVRKAYCLRLPNARGLKRQPSRHPSSARRQTPSDKHRLWQVETNNSGETWDLSMSANKFSTCFCVCALTSARLWDWPDVPHSLHSFTALYTTGPIVPDRMLCSETLELVETALWLHFKLSNTSVHTVLVSVTWKCWYRVPKKISVHNWKVKL